MCQFAAVDFIAVLILVQNRFPFVLLHVFRHSKRRDDHSLEGSEWARSYRIFAHARMRKTLMHAMYAPQSGEIPNNKHPRHEHTCQRIRAAATTEARARARVT